MLLENNSTQSTYKIIPQGVHLARCFMYADIGTQATTFGDKRQLLIYFEIHGEDPNTGDPLLTEKGDPMTIFKKYTLSWNEKSILRQDLESWRGGAFSPEERKRFDLKNILGKWCMINVSHTQDKNNATKVWDNIKGITPVPQQIKKGGLPEPVNDEKHFELDRFSQESFDQLPNFAKTRIMKSLEWGKINGKVDKPYDDMNDSIPF